MRHNFKYYCKDYENIENYEKALADNFKCWCIHHRLETHTSDGERRLVDITKKELIALGMYCNRPASELIFLTVGEHTSLHYEGEHNPNYGKQLSEKTRTKISEAWSYDKHFTEETKKKISEAMKGRCFSEEHRKKLSEVSKGKHKGMHWYNNNITEKFCYECPPGVVPGRIKKP